MTRFLFILLLLPASALATEIEDYVPPPMFGEETQVQIPEASDFPPLPPHRPDKLKASQSYIDYLRKHGKAPAVIHHRNRAPVRDILQENLIQPSAQDILDQINPQ